MYRYRARVLLCVALLFHLSLLASWRMGFWNRFTFDATATHGRRGWDFYAVYQAGHNVLTGVSVYESDDDKIEVVVPRYTPYRYLPVMAYTLGVALNQVPPLWAFRLWVMITEFVLLGCAYVSWRLVRGHVCGAILASMWLCFTPYYLEIYLGQFSLVQAGFVFLMMLATLRPTLESLFDGAWVVSLLWKQNTALFWPIFVRLRRWRALGWAMLAVAATSIPYFVLYPSALSAFAGNFRFSPPSHQLGNLGVRQFLFSLLSATWPDLSSSTQRGIQVAWVAGIAIGGLWLTLRQRPLDVLLSLCFWTTTYFLVYHDVWEHHYVLLLPVFVFLYHRTGSWTVLAFYALVAIWTPYILIDPTGWAGYHAPMRWTPLEPRILDVVYHASKAVPTLVLWGYIVALMRRRAAVTAD